jgi:hypothetical protein
MQIVGERRQPRDAGVLEGFADELLAAAGVVEESAPRLDLAYLRRRRAHGLP